MYVHSSILSMRTGRANPSRPRPMLRSEPSFLREAFQLAFELKDDERGAMARDGVCSWGTLPRSAS